MKYVHNPAQLKANKTDLRKPGILISILKRVKTQDFRLVVFDLLQGSNISYPVFLPKA